MTEYQPHTYIYTWNKNDFPPAYVSITRSMEPHPTWYKHQEAIYLGISMESIDFAPVVTIGFSKVLVADVEANQCSESWGAYHIQ